jgi:archaeal flagellar protein FlaJ
MKFPLLNYINKNRKLLYVILFLGLLGIVFITFGFFILSPMGLSLESSIFNVFGILLLITPFSLVQFKFFRTQKEIEEIFPEFVKAIAEGLESDMSLPQSIKFAAENDFGSLSPYIKKIVTQMSWGISFENAFFNFTNELNNKIITRAVSTIVAAHKSGGEIKTAISSIVHAVTEIEKLRRERLARISGQMIQGYVIYFVFLGVMIGIQQFLIPILSTGNLMGGGSEADNVNTAIVEEYSIRFRHLAVVQGFFSGIAIGKLAEGSVSAGLKHAFILSFLGYIIMVLTNFM